MDHKKIEQRRVNEKIKQSVSRDLKSEGSFSEAINLLEFNEISERSTSSWSNSLNECTQNVPIRLKHDISKNTRVYAHYLDNAETNGEQNMNPSTYYATTKRAFTYNSSTGRMLIGQRAEDEIYTFQRRRKKCSDNVKNDLS